MKRMSRFLKIAINFALGYILIPTGILAFLIMTNSSKGWGVYDQDGLWFVPVGVFLMLLCVSFVVVQIVSFVRFLKVRESNRYTSLIMCTLGVTVYLMQWLLTR